LIGNGEHKMRTQPTDHRAAERSVETQPAYVYIINHGGTLYHLTNYDRDVVITGLPATHGSTPQTFVACQAKHTAIRQRSEINAPEVELTIALNQTPFADELKAYILSAVPNQITVTIARLNTSSLPDGAVWSDDAYVIFKGAALGFQFNAFQCQLSLISLVMQNNGKVPRYFWQKTCQHALYGDQCGLNREDAHHKVVTTLAAVSDRARFVEIADTTIDGDAINAATFQGGMLKIGTKLIAITSSTILGGSGGTRLYLSWWDSALIASASVTAYRGCRRTVADCKDIFSNLSAFGGMPYIPTVNPTIHSVRTPGSSTP
jgi:hypothetical protein